jgi:hypothetical protein
MLGCIIDLQGTLHHQRGAAMYSRPVKETMEGYKIIGTLGACILVAGVFVPARFTRMVGYISYYSDHQTNALILIALATIAVVLVFTGSPARLMTFGLLTLAVVTWAFLRRAPGIQLVEGSMGQIAAQAASLTVVRDVSDSIVTNTPWWIMLFGSALLVMSGLMQSRRA